jgi:hypothetical protein
MSAIMRSDTAYFLMCFPWYSALCSVRLSICISVVSETRFLRKGKNPNTLSACLTFPLYDFTSHIHDCWNSHPSGYVTVTSWMLQQMQFMPWLSPFYLGPSSYILVATESIYIITSSFLHSFSNFHYFFSSSSISKLAILILKLSTWLNFLKMVICNFL